MTKEEIIAFMRDNTYGYLATTENSEPRVRGMMHFITADGEIVYHTGKGKAVGTQLLDGSPVELCVFDTNSGQQVRIRGNVKIVNDPSLTEALIVDRPFIKSTLDAIGKDKLLVIKVVNAKATVWTMEKNFDPQVWIEL